MEKTSLKSKNIILFFAWLSLIFGLISFPETFIQYSWVSSSKTYLMEFVFPDILNLIFGIISIAYKVMLVIYLTKWNLEKKNHLTFSVAIGMIAFHYFISLVYEIIYISDYFYYMYLIYIVIYTAIITMLIFVIINVLRGEKKNLFIIVASAIVFLLSAYNIIQWIGDISWYIEDGYYFYIITWIAGIISGASIFISLPIFLLKNRIPAIIRINPDKIKSREANYSPAQSLRNLKDKYDMGLITEEEYQKSRTDIISKL